MSKTRKQPAALARAREERERARLEVRKVQALERIAAALEGQTEYAKRLLDAKPKTVILPARERPPRTTLFDDELPLDRCGVRGCTVPALPGLGWCEEHRENPLKGVYDGG